MVSFISFFLRTHIYACIEICTLSAQHRPTVLDNNHSSAKELPLWDLMAYLVYPP